MQPTKRFVREKNYLESRKSCVSILIDISGSMKAYYSEIHRILKAFIKYLKESEKYKDAVVINIFLFDTDVDEKVIYKPLNELTEKDLEIPMEEMGGGTDIGKVLLTAIANTERFIEERRMKAGVYKPFLLVITDGKSNAGLGATEDGRLAITKNFEEACEKINQLKKWVLQVIKLDAESESHKENDEELEELKRLTQLVDVVTKGDEFNIYIDNVFAVFDRTMPSSTQEVPIYVTPV